MGLNLPGFLPVILFAVTSLVLIWRLNWRWTLLALVGQYLAVFGVVQQNWPLGLSLVKLVVGAVSSGILVSSLTYQPELLEADRAGRLFRSMVVLFIWVIVFFSAEAIQSWLKVDRDLLWAALILTGSGLVQLGMTVQPVRTAIGLLCFLAGFELLYAALEISVLVAGSLAVINLGIALGGAFLSSLPERGAQP